MVNLTDYTKCFDFIYKVCPDWVQWIYRNSPDQRRRGSCLYPTGEVLLLGICLYLFRYPSLRSFVKEFQTNKVALTNLNQFFRINDIPSDDGIRYILGKIPTNCFNQILRLIHVRLERKKLIQPMRLLNKFDLVSLDRTGQLSSYKITCEKCLTRKSVKDDTLFLHGQLVATLISPNQPLALTLAYEPIENESNRSEYDKNDCELNAGKRLLKNLRSHYPKRNFCITGDNLFSSINFIQQIKSYDWSFIITAKPERNKELFSMYDYVYEKKQNQKFTDKVGHQHHYEWSNQIPLKLESNPEKQVLVNLLEYTEINLKGEIVYYNSWVTNISLNFQNIKDIAKGGRARFQIENCTFNEQKTRGYHLEHNFGHFGNLPNVFFGLAQIAHLFSQLFSLWRVGKKLISEIGSQRRYWERLATLLTSIPLPNHGLPIINLKFEFNTG